MSCATIRQRAKRVKTVGDRARSLLQALDALDERDRGTIADRTEDCALAC
jgi:hypothetical protein